MNIQTLVAMCVQCGSTSNTMKDLSSHMSFIHRDPQVRYCFCPYVATSCTRMRCHVHVHTKGEQCSLCKRTFPTAKALARHVALHKQRTMLGCELCDASFSSMSSLAIHVWGKHGTSYICITCQKCFDSPAQRKCHSAKCGKH